MRSTLHRARRVARATVLAGAVLVAAGCQLGPRPLTQAYFQPSGEWAVVGVHATYAGVRDPAQAMARFGQVVRYEPDAVVSGPDTCTRPKYLVNAMLADRYLRREQGLTASGLGLYQWQDLRFVEVFCDGNKWKRFGGEAFWVDYDRGFVVHDHVLYEVRRVGAPPPS